MDADASDEELTWGRQSLRAYRPDLVLLQDPPAWNYCMIVKTDVAYATPDWYKSPRSYDQILSGGGKVSFTRNVSVPLVLLLKKQILTDVSFYHGSVVHGPGMVDSSVKHLEFRLGGPTTGARGYDTLDH